MSAMPASMKRTSLTQTVIRTRRNTRPELPWSVTENLLINFSARMKASGYDEHYRYQVIKSGMEGFDNMLEEERRGGRQMNAPRSWQEDQRQRIATKILVQERRIWRASLCATHPRGGDGQENKSNVGRKQPGTRSAHLVAILRSKHFNCIEYYSKESLEKNVASELTIQVLLGKKRLTTCSTSIQVNILFRDTSACLQQLESNISLLKTSSHCHTQ